MFQYDATQGKNQSAGKLPKRPGLLLLEHNMLHEKGIYFYSGLGILS